MIKAVLFNSQTCYFSKKQLFLACLGIPYIVLIVMGWSNYFIWESPLSWLGLIGFVFLHSSYPKNDKASARYFYPAILLIVVTFFLPVKTFLYFSVVFGILLLVESFFVKGNHLAVFLFIAISPIFNYFITAFTFPVRLYLSYLATRALSIVDPSIKQAGNIIQTASNDFSVDPECMGLNMVSMGVLTGILLLGYYQHRTRSGVSVFKSFLFLSGLFVLVIVSNFFRILCLVHFNIPAGTWMHEMIGILCFAGYVILPATFFIQRMSRNACKIPARIHNSNTVFSRTIVLKNYTVCGCLFAAMLYVHQVKEVTNATSHLKAPVLNGYSSEMADRDIVKLENNNVLVYIKHIMGFYSTEHSPMICWKGSGYELKKIQRELFAGRDVYTAVLVKDNDKLYTCWWFDNGTAQTIDQLTWRWKSMRGAADFSIINVTAATKNKMKEEAITILNSNSIKNILIKTAYED